MISAFRSTYRERTAIVGRAAIAISIGPVLFFMWQAIGLPPVPGLDFASPGTHQPDSGLVVRIAGTRHATLDAHPLRSPAGTRAAAMQKRHAARPMTSSPPQPPRPPRVTAPEAKVVPPTTSEASPARAVSRKTPAAVSSAGATPATPPVTAPKALPAAQSPQLPVVQGPALPAAPPLPPVVSDVLPVLPVLPAVPAVAVPPVVKPLGLP